MSKDKKNKLSDDNNQDNLTQTPVQEESVVYGLTPITGRKVTFPEMVVGTIPITTKTVEIKNSEVEQESEYFTELNEILTQLHETDSYIGKTRQNTIQLGVETRSMLDELRKQLG